MFRYLVDKILLFFFCIPRKVRERYTDKHTDRIWDKADKALWRMKRGGMQNLHFSNKTLMLFLYRVPRNACEIFRE